MGGTDTPQHKVRFVTAAALFDGHDAAINIIRRLLQAHGAEVIHLGHNRSVAEIVDAAIQEDAQGIAVSSYQGGHMEFFTYMVDLLRERGAGHVKVFGGGGGVIVPEEIAELQAYGVTRIFSPDDGRTLGLDGMIDAMLGACAEQSGTRGSGSGARQEGAPSDRGGAGRIDFGVIARLISEAEQGKLASSHLRTPSPEPRTPVVGITGTGGAGKSSLTDELVRRFLADYPDLTIAVLAVDPTKRRTGGALLGDRIRMNSLGSERVYMRSLATRQAHHTLSVATKAAIDVCVAAGFGLVLVESAGAGQGDSEIADLADQSVYVMTPEYGASMQLEKIDMLDFADFVAINKFDRPGALDALRDVRKQLRRNRNEFTMPDEGLPAFPTCAHQFHDRGVNALYIALVSHLEREFGGAWHLDATHAQPAGVPERHPLIPGERVGYLREIAGACRSARSSADAQARLARTLYQLVGARACVSGRHGAGDHADLWQLFEEIAASKPGGPGSAPAPGDAVDGVGAGLAPSPRR